MSDEQPTLTADAVAAVLSEMLGQSEVEVPDVILDALEEWKTLGERLATSERLRMQDGCEHGEEMIDVTRAAGKWLAEYGEHRPGCSALGVLIDGPCSCGFADVLRRYSGFGESKRESKDELRARIATLEREATERAARLAEVEGELARYRDAADERRAAESREWLLAHEPPLSRGNLIPWIKWYRELERCTLRDAKEEADRRVDAQEVADVAAGRSEP